MKPFAIATNNGDIGGGEVMLFNIAEALRGLGFDVTVVAPREPGEVAEQARLRDFKVEVLPASNRPSYMWELFRWRLRNIRVPLWCNGLVPSTATAGLGPRIIEFHILPEGANTVASWIARLGRPTLLVPSYFMAKHVKGSRVLQNWTEPVSVSESRGGEGDEGPVRIGFLGRLVRDKGPHVLAKAVSELIQEGHDVELVVAGVNRFGTDDDDLEIRRSFDDLGERVRFLGWVAREEFFRKVDVAVFPSVFPEPFGLVIPEAMSVGSDFIISDAGAMPEVAGSEHLWIAIANDVNSLTQVLREYIESDCGVRQLARKSAYKRWERDFSPAAGLARIRRLLSNMEGSSDGPA